MFSKLLMNVGVIAGFLGLFVQWRIFEAPNTDATEKTVFIPWLGSGGINAPASLGIAYYVCTAIFLASACGLLFLLLRSRSR